MGAAPGQKMIQVEITSPDKPVWLVPKQAIIMALIINELTTNSIKYAYSQRHTGQIRIRIVTVDAGGMKITMEYRDDGPGYPQHVLSGSNQRVGLTLIRTNVEDTLRGRLELLNQDGAVTLIHFRPEIRD